MPGRKRKGGAPRCRAAVAGVRRPGSSRRNRRSRFFGRDITELARRGKLEPVIGRKDEILRVARILSQKRKANPVLVGAPGVGKTGIVEGLAQRVAARGVPGVSARDADFGDFHLRAHRRRAVSRAFEERLQAVVKEAEADWRSITTSTKTPSGPPPSARRTGSSSVKPRRATAAPSSTPSSNAAGGAASIRSPISGTSSPACLR